MSLYRFADTNRGLIYTPTGPRAVAFPPDDSVLTPVPLNSRLVGTGHSIMDAVLKYPMAGVILDAGLTPAIWSGTGPYATAWIRWNDDPASPNAVRSLMQAGGAAYDLFLGIEAHGGGEHYGGRDSVQTHYQWSDARGYALRWHNLAASTGAQAFYANFWRNDPSDVFGSEWRAAHTVVVDSDPEFNMSEPQLWDAIIDYVNANRNPGTPAMRLLPWLQVFMAVYDAIQAGTVTGITMRSLFSDTVHPSNTGRWVQVATMMAVMYQRHPSELSNTISGEFGATLSIDSGLAAQLRPVIWNTCVGLARTGLGS